MKIVVYCSSMEGLEKKYQQLAAALGTWIGQNGHTLLYVPFMKLVATSSASFPRCSGTASTPCVTR